MSVPFSVFGQKELIKNKFPVVMSFGNFDGVHVGHRYLIQQMKKEAGGLPVVLVTFFPHPASFFSPENPKKLLSTFQQKIALLLEQKVDTVIVQPFDAEFASFSADEFCQKWLLEHFLIHTVFVGYDFCYGKGRKGNDEHMIEVGRQHHFAVRTLKPYFESPVSSQIVSSSFIRQLLHDGRCEQAESLLARPYSLSGVVVQGDQRGRTIGFPTANMRLDEPMVIPKYGVYSCFVEVEEDGILLPGIMNCGVRPTVSGGLNLQVEAHIFNFSLDIYTKKINFYLKKYIRGEKKFSSLDELKNQIVEDIKECK